MLVYLALASLLDVPLRVYDKTGITSYNNLFSFYYLKSPASQEKFRKVCSISDNVLVDSGAHSFQHGASVKWDDFMRKYIKFIQEYDAPNVHGFFELDVDNVLPYSTVLGFREQLEEVSDKIIPVWHSNRGIRDFKDMCEKYDYVSIPCIKNMDIQDKQFVHFVKYAHRCGCKIHGLGLTRKNILDVVPFDSVDSSSWSRQFSFATYNGSKVDSDYFRENVIPLQDGSYIRWRKFQEKYYKKWNLIKS